MKYILGQLTEDGEGGAEGKPEGSGGSDGAASDDEEEDDDDDVDGEEDDDAAPEPEEDEHPKLTATEKHALVYVLYPSLHAAHLPLGRGGTGSLCVPPSCNALRS